jgi:hypothetical protein
LLPLLLANENETSPNDAFDTTSESPIPYSALPHCFFSVSFSLSRNFAPQTILLHATRGGEGRGLRSLHRQRAREENVLPGERHCETGHHGDQEE